MNKDITTIELTPVKELTLDQKQQVLLMKDKLLAYFNTIESELISHGNLEFFNKLEKKSNRAWIKDQDLIINTLVAQGIEPTEPKLKSLGEIIKLVGEKGVDGLFNERKVTGYELKAKTELEQIRTAPVKKVEKIF